MSAFSSMSQSSSREEENAISPSGVQVGCASSKSPSVSCFASAGAVGRNDEDVPAPVTRPADAVELELEALEPPGRPFLVVFFLVGVVLDARGEGDLSPVR